jgi:hypothetical protein
VQQFAGWEHVGAAPAAATVEGLVKALKIVPPLSPTAPSSGLLPRIGTTPTPGAANLSAVIDEVWSSLGMPAPYFWQQHLTAVSTEIGMVGGRRRLRYDRVGAIFGSD